ncbi:MAG: alanine racemase [Gemmatimonadota bacterium]
MEWSRRSFLSAAAALPVTPAALAAMSGPHPRPAVDSFEPWIQVDPAAIASNARAISRLAGGRPVIAVVKNNAYGLGVRLVGEILRDVEDIRACAVVTPGAAHELADARLGKPILLMARVEDADAEALVRRGVRLATADASAGDQIERIARRLGEAVPVHAYLDTGMNRLGVPFRDATEFLVTLGSSGAATIEGTFMGFAEEDEFDALQLARFEKIADDVRRAGVSPGALHAASSHGLFFRGEALLDMVRPGLVVYGAYPAGARETRAASLTPAFRLRARVARVTRLEAGDGVSYGQNYVAERPTWVATLPVGHADGYPRRAVDGCEVLIGERTYPVIGAVSASHTIVEVGEEQFVRAGDEAILLGPDHPAIHPNEVAERAGISVYDVLMHLSARLPRRV